MDIYKAIAFSTDHQQLAEKIAKYNILYIYKNIDSISVT